MISTPKVFDLLKDAEEELEYTERTKYPNLSTSERRYHVNKAENLINQAKQLMGLGNNAK